MAIVKTGSFVKNASMGASTQDVAHGLGETPKLLILWTVAETTGTGFRVHNFPSIGITDDDRDSICVGGASDDNLAATNSAKYIGTDAIAIVNPTTLGTFARASISAWDSTDFTVSWNADTASAAAWVIGWLAVGGSTVESNVVYYTQAGTTGATSITGASLTGSPTLAFFLNAGNSVGALPVSSTIETVAIGVAHSTGQWGVAVSSHDAQGAAITARLQRTDNCVVGLTISDSIDWLASFTSFDSDGCTIDVTNAPSANSRLGVVFVRGLDAHVGSFNKSTDAATATQDVSTPGVNPLGVMLASDQNTASTSVIANARMGIGFSDGTTEYSGAIQDEDAADPTNASGTSSTTKAFQKVNNATDTIDAECDLTMRNRAFRASWTTNDAVDTQLVYVALGNAAGGGGGGGGSGGQGGGGGNGGGGGGNGGNGGPPGGGGGSAPPGQVRRTIIGQQRRKRRGLVGIF
jgi:hypothetical protein